MPLALVEAERNIRSAVAVSPKVPHGTEVGGKFVSLPLFFRIFYNCFITIVIPIRTSNCTQ